MLQPDAVREGEREVAGDDERELGAGEERERDREDFEDDCTRRSPCAPRRRPPRPAGSASSGACGRPRRRARRSGSRCRSRRGRSTRTRWPCRAARPVGRAHRPRPGAASTSTFLTHCFGRASRSNARGVDDAARQRAGARSGTGTRADLSDALPPDGESTKARLEASVRRSDLERFVRDVLDQLFEPVGGDAVAHAEQAARCPSRATRPRCRRRIRARPAGRGRCRRP